MLVPELEVDDELALAAAVTLFPGPGQRRQRRARRRTATTTWRLIDRFVDATDGGVRACI